MKLLADHFHEQLERYRTHRSEQNKNGPLSSASPFDEQEEVESLLTLAQSLQKAKPMQVDSQFAHLLEQQLLAAAAQHVHAGQTLKKEEWRHKFWLIPMRLTMPRLRMVCAGVCLLALGLGVSFLALSMHTAPPQTTQTVTMQIEQTEAEAHTQLHLLLSLANPAHAQAYRQELVKLDKQITDCAHEASAMPTGTSSWAHANEELTELKQLSRQELYQLLQDLALPEQVVTTTELGHLGATVPVVQNAQFTFIPSTNQATVFLLGSGILPGAHLLIGNQEYPETGVLQNGGFEITIPWSTQLALPQQLGILNTNHTAAQTTALTTHDGDDHGADDGGGDDGGHRGGGGGGHDGSHSGRDG